MNKQVISFKLNEQEFSCYTHSSVMLCEVLYAHGCRSVSAGCITNGSVILVDGEAINPCNYPVLRAEGRSVITLEWLEKSGGELATIQQEFLAIASLCNDCASNVIMACLPLLAAGTAPSRYRIASAVKGLLCCDFNIEDVITVVTNAYNKEKLNIAIVDRQSNQTLPEILNVKYAKKKDSPIQLTAVEGTSMTSATILPESGDIAPRIAEPVVAPQPVPIPQPQPTPIEPIVSAEPEPEPVTEPVEEQAPEQMVPASIFDEGFAESLESGKKLKRTEEKPKAGFFSKFTAAFKEKHHKTLEIPEIETEE